ncbi:MAG: Hsp20/alpha crystallin family protein [Deltaproteobacteria bacterium]|nr:Hsp20/alpha crystallin family protein [Candidatus Anaeroferrophillus wilburensis]MBN2888847.1 Hsp20/alpha crystallin family protein [Deltaproteobacteria bacterium]
MPNGTKHLHVVSPLVDIYEAAGELVVCVDLPGVPKDQVRVEFEDSCLRITSEKPASHRSGGMCCLLEREYGHCAREFELPDKVSPEQATAELVDGVLMIRIPMIS